MIGAFLTFVFLFGAIKVFENGRDDIDTFQLLTAVVVPGMASGLTTAAVGAFLVEIPSLRLLPFAVGMGVTFGVLWKILGIPAERTILYTLGIFALHIGVWVLSSSP